MKLFLRIMGAMFIVLFVLPIIIVYKFILGVCIIILAIFLILDFTYPNISKLTLKITRAFKKFQEVEK